MAAREERAAAGGAAGGGDAGVGLATRRSFFEITPADLALLASLHGFAERVMDEVVEEFYELLLGHAETRAFFPDEATVVRVKALQKRYFVGLFSGACDEVYAAERLRVGATHERIGMSPVWYFGAYSRYLRIIFDKLARELRDPAALKAAQMAVAKVIFFDVSLAMDAYISAGRLSTLRQQAAIRELSTPVIRVLEGVLLLPLIGTIDTLRATQVMETVLTRIVAEQARVVIIDIAGVAVVDTKVAESLLRTTSAINLLGARTIVTGISAEVARTVVQLGVDVSSMYTRGTLASGLELAMSLLGRTVAVAEQAP